jgi:hypothetical protein
MYGFEQPKRKKGGVAAIAIVVGTLVLILLVVVVVVSLSGSDDPETMAHKAATEAGQNLESTPGLSYSGSYGGRSADFGVTKAGSAYGTYTAHGSRVSRVDVGGVTYIKSDSGFWASEGVTSASATKANGKWTKAPADAVHLKLADLSPTALGAALKRAGNEPAAAEPTAVKTSIDGTPTVKMSVGTTTYYLSTSSPHRLVRIEGDAGSDAYSLDVTTLKSDGMGPLFTRLRAGVQGLAGAYDPAVTMVPIGKIQFVGCTESGCTVRGTAMASAAGVVGTTIHVTMNAKFWGDGPTVSTCTGTGTTTPSHETTITCRTSGGAWASWYKSHNGRFTIHASSTFEATVNSASDISALLSRLNQEQQGG